MQNQYLCPCFLHLNSISLYRVCIDIIEFSMPKLYLNVDMDDIICAEKIQAQGLTPLKDILKQMGGWPAVEGPTWNDTSFDWVNNTYINKRLGYTVDLLVDFSVTTNIKNTSWRIIDVSISLVTFPTPIVPKRLDILFYLCACRSPLFATTHGRQAH